MKRIYSRHGMTGTKIHEVWKEMHRRCKEYHHSVNSYKNKGIKVCEEWRNAKTFIDWALANGYAEGLQLDRTNNDGGYSSANCRWVSPRENANNKANTIKIQFSNEDMSLYHWGEKLNINPRTLYTRLARGWSIERTLTTPVQKKAGQS